MKLYTLNNLIPILILVALGGCNNLGHESDSFRNYFLSRFVNSDLPQFGYSEDLTLLNLDEICNALKTHGECYKDDTLFSDLILTLKTSSNQIDSMITMIKMLDLQEADYYETSWIKSTMCISVPLSPESYGIGILVKYDTNFQKIVVKHDCEHLECMNTKVESADDLGIKSVLPFYKYVTSNDSCNQSVMLYSKDCNSYILKSQTLLKSPIFNTANY